MKRTLLILLTAILLISVSANAQKKSKKADNKFLGSYFKDNYVWGGAMNLCWNELCDNILKGDLQLKTDDLIALNMAKIFNERYFTLYDLNEESYYIKSGFGQKTVNKINKESKKKFPTKSFPDLDFELGPFEIISYAYFLKELEFSVQFEEKTVTFNDIQVKGFQAKNFEQKRNIKIIEYKNKNKFIISLKLKNNEDQLIIAKGYNISVSDLITTKINEYSTGEYQNMRDEDIFEMPNINIDYKRRYNELTGKRISNIDYEEFAIGVMFENIKFNIDHKGARIENQAVITVFSGLGNEKLPKQRELRLDKPFWIIMKQVNSNNPYFILGVNNTEIMELDK